MKSGKVVLVLSGKYAGRKGIVVKVGCWFRQLIQRKFSEQNVFRTTMKVRQNDNTAMHWWLALTSTL